MMERWKRDVRAFLTGMSYVFVPWDPPPRRRRRSHHKGVAAALIEDRLLIAYDADIAYQKVVDRDRKTRNTGTTGENR